MVLWRPTRPSTTNTLKRCPFHYRELECKCRKSRDAWSNRQIWPWSTKWSRSKANRVLPREHTGHSKHPLAATHGKILHVDITRWSILKSGWLYSLQPKMEILYTVSKSKTYDCYSDHELLIAISSVQLLSCVWLFGTPWIAACQASLSITNSQSSLKLISIESVMPSSHLILCRPLLLLPSIPPSIRVFPMSQLLAWGGQSIGVSASASVLPMNTKDWSPLGWTSWISLQSKGLSRVFSNTTLQKHQFFGTQLSSQANSHIHTWPQEKP